AGRTCYKSEEKITDDSAIEFCRSIIKRGHLSVIEHTSITVKFIIDRGISHEFVRHRLCAFSQESTRYCNYKNRVTFVIPPWITDILPGWYDNLIDNVSNTSRLWFDCMFRAEENYRKLLELGWIPQQARSILPNSLKTELVVTANLREWQHIFSLRCAEVAHPQMREVMNPLREEFRKRIPVIFNKENKYGIT
ncbi:MAG: FAD-dependent thymidylate synthase, partial [Bacillota bacterium]